LVYFKSNFKGCPKCIKNTQIGVQSN